MWHAPFRLRASHDRAVLKPVACCAVSSDSVVPLKANCSENHANESQKDRLRRKGYFSPYCTNCAAKGITAEQGCCERKQLIENEGSFPLLLYWSLSCTCVGGRAFMFVTVART